MSARRVLLLNHGSQVSGAERSALALATHVDPGRYELTVAAPDEGPLLEMTRAAGVPASSIDTRPATLREPVVLLSNARALRQEIRARRICLVHANSFHAAKQVAPLAFLRRVPLVTSIRDIVPMTRPTMAALMCSRLVACVSEATAAHVRSLAPPRHHDRIRVVHNGVDPSALRLEDPPPRNAVLGIDDPSAVTIGMLAPLVPWKGQDLFLRASARALAAAAPPAHVFVIGGDQFCPPEYRRLLETSVRSAELAGHAHLLGHRADVAEVLSALDVVVCASTSPDPLPRAVLEAMAAGRAVVGPDAGGVPEQIVHGESGWLFPMGDEDALARLLEILIENPQARRSAGEMAARRAEQIFSIERHSRAMQDIYDEALGAG